MNDPAEQLKGFWYYYIKEFSHPMLRLLVFVLIIKTVFILTTGYGVWQGELSALILLLITVAVNTYICGKFRIKHEKLVQRNKFIIFNEKFAIIGGAVVFAVYLFDAWSRINSGPQMPAGFSIISRDLLQALVLALTLMVLIADKTLLRLCITHAGEKFRELFVFRAAVFTAIIIICVTVNLFSLGRAFTTVQIIWVGLIADVLVGTAVLKFPAQIKREFYLTYSNFNRIVLTGICLAAPALAFLTYNDIIWYFGISTYDVINFAPVSTEYYGALFTMFVLAVLSGYWITMRSTKSLKGIAQPVAVIAVGQILLLYGGGSYFRCAGLGTTGWVIVLLFNINAYILYLFAAKAKV